MSNVVMGSGTIRNFCPKIQKLKNSSKSSETDYNEVKARLKLKEKTLNIFYNDLKNIDNLVRF
jgi:hypothetical protein